MDVIRSPRGKGGRFTKKGEDSTLVSPSNPLLSFATVALATVAVASAQPCLTPSELPRGELAPKTKRRRSDEHLLKDEHIRSERYAGHTLKFEGTHSSLASQALSEGDPYKRMKRALNAASKKWTFQIDDDGSMFDCSPEGIRMEGEGLQSSRRCAIAYLFEHVHGNAPESEWQGRGGCWGAVGQG